MSSMNCWEYLQCGKENSCPAGTLTVANGFLGGKNGGRGCVYITGTFCSGTVQGTFQDKEKECQDCDFYQKVRQENGHEMNVLAFNRFVRSHS